MKRRHWILIGFCVFAALVTFLTLYGWATHSEPTTTDARRWESAPLDVFAAGYGDGLDSDERGSLESAIATTNRRLGFTAFRLKDDGSAPVIAIIGVPSEPGWMDPGGTAVLRSDGDQITGCRIETSNTGTLEILTLTLRHELGHCLNLAHDDFERSIMRPTQRHVPDGEIGPWITDADRAALRELYR